MDIRELILTTAKNRRDQGDPMSIEEIADLAQSYVDCKHRGVSVRGVMTERGFNTHHTPKTGMTVKLADDYDRCSIPDFLEGRTFFMSSRTNIESGVVNGKIMIKGVGLFEASNFIEVLS